MIILELKDPKIMSEDEKFGYTYWSLTDGDYPVMFNSKNPNILPGMRVMAQESQLKISAKGNEYLRLKKVSIEEKAEDNIPFNKKDKPEPVFKEKSDSSAYLRDATTTPIQMYNGSLNYAKDAGLNIITDSEDRRVYLEYVKEITDEILDWIEIIRNGGSLSKVPDTIKEPVVATGYDKARQARAKLTNDFDESDVPEEYAGA